ncbi:hypothetical protein F4780DRAFT_761346 [Xylariomycetidae sp. FL0641]|nr:hypothetical protein F4780DRAFT_761346 [Xylariomycetidae sp. FL0641]
MPPPYVSFPEFPNSATHQPNRLSCFFVFFSVASLTTACCGRGVSDGRCPEGCQRATTLRIYLTGATLPTPLAGRWRKRSGAWSY